MNCVVRAPGKVNLCLFVGPRRNDRRHELVTLLESVSLADELTVSTGKRLADTVRCPDVEGPNLASLALERLRAQGWDGPPLQIDIAKRIPVAGGMGGGSADAAAVLRLANELRTIPEPTLAEIAAGLGADVPSQLHPGLALGTGAGDHVQAQSPLEPHALLVLPQPYRLSASDVYDEADRLELAREQAELDEQLDQLKGVLGRDGRLPQSLLVNDLEQAAISLLPQTGDALAAALEARADHALVSGSGPTVLGLFWGEDGAARARCGEEQLRGRFPAATTAVPVQSEFAEPRCAE